MTLPKKFVAKNATMILTDLKTGEEKRIPVKDVEFTAVVEPGSIRGGVMKCRTCGIDPIVIYGRCEKCNANLKLPIRGNNNV
jgi:hypothetical protein